MKTKRMILLLGLMWLCYATAIFAQSIPPVLHARIIQLEDERNLNGDELTKLLRHASPKVRERAALAIGRIGDKRGTAALIELLQSEKDESVRAMTAFALGEMEDAAAVPALLEFLTPGKYPIFVRARPVESLGKIAGVPANLELLGKATVEQISNRLIEQLPNPEFTLTADKKPTAGLTITALMRARPASSVEPLTRQLKSTDADLRAQAANALARIRQPIASAVTALLEALNDSDHNVRANAARALGVSKDTRAVEPLSRLLTDENVQVQVSAVRALAVIGDRHAVDPLVGLLKSQEKKTASWKNQARLDLSLEIAAALGTLGDKKALPTLLTLCESQLPNRIAEIEIALAKLSEERIAELGARLTDLVKGECPAWKETQVIAQTINAVLPLKEFRNWKAALGGLTVVLAVCEHRGLPEVMRAVNRLAFDPAHSSFFKLNSNSDVSDSPIKDREAENRKFLLLLFRKKLESTDEVIRATAATILGERTNEDSLQPLIESWVRANDGKSDNAKLPTLTALSKYKSATALEAVKTGLTDTDHLVRSHAVNLLKQMGAGDFSDRIGTVQTGHDRLFYQRAAARMNRKITATLHTDKGAITMELFPQDAPLTVDSFITLARKGYFNNLTFHRVVPNFVIQGGDPRGDGEGGPGYQIRCEVNTRPYQRGAVGMALSGKDTGGSQFFITHSPQPHLDGGYTVFGQVTGGMEVVDRIVRGDAIRRIVITER